jgi:hypothetical protein
MRRGCLLSLLITALLLPAFADDREKAEKQIRMTTAMARDAQARSIISRTLADRFKVSRLQLTGERKTYKLNYGSLFLAHELSGSSLDLIVTGLREHKPVLQIADETKANWKRIASDAKRFHDAISDNIYKHFLNSKRDQDRDLEEHYNPDADLIAADSDSTPEEIARAQQDYIFWRNLAAPPSDRAADSSNPVSHDYKETRDNIGYTHGTVAPGSPGH